jgi:hypothetical protein
MAAYVVGEGAGAGTGTGAMTEGKLMESVSVLDRVSNSSEYVLGSDGIRWRSLVGLDNLGYLG